MILGNSMIMLIDFALTLRQFMDTVNAAAPELVNSKELRRVIESMMSKQEGREYGKLSVVDFLVLLTLFTKLTLKQKLGLLFEILCGFQKTYSQKNGIK